MLPDFAVPVSASLAASISVLVGYPFDTIKTRMQAYKYTSTWACMKHTYRGSGVVGFYSGVGPVLSSIVLLRAASFSIYSSMRTYFMDHMSNTSASIASGAITGTIVASVNAPIEFIKIQRQLERINDAIPHPSARISPVAISTVPSSVRHSTIGWFQRIYAKKGIAGLYTCAHFHIARDAIGTALYFGGYEIVKGLLTPLNTPSSSFTQLVLFNFRSMISGGIAGSACWIVIFPIDVIKSVVQKESMKDEPRVKSAMEFCKKAWKKYGIARFYSGLTPQLIRSFPVHALNFLVYERCLLFLKGVK